MLRDELFGVISLYKTGSMPFSADHQRILEAMADPLAVAFQATIDNEEVFHRDSVTGLPNARRLFVGGFAIFSRATDYATLSTRLLLVRLKDVRELKTHYEANVFEEMIRHVARKIQSQLRMTDVLFRLDPDGFVILMTTECAEATSLLVRLQAAIAGDPYVSRIGPIDVSIDAVEVSWAADRTIEQAIADATERLGRSNSPSPGRHTIH